MPSIAFKLLAIVTVVAHLSCKKSSDEQRPVIPVPPPKTLADMLSCHNSVGWDSLEVNNKLIGRWEWQHIRCYANPEAANNNDFAGLQVEFKADNTLQIKENGVITQTSSWQVAPSSDGFYKINTTPYAILLPGKIVFCDTLAMFYDTYVDGCDNYFKQVD